MTITHADRQKNRYRKKFKPAKYSWMSKVSTELEGKHKFLSLLPSTFGMSEHALKQASAKASVLRESNLSAKARGSNFPRVGDRAGWLSLLCALIPSLHYY